MSAGTAHVGDQRGSRSDATEHHDGKESRVIPLFPELVPYLLDCSELADPKDKRVITKYTERYSSYSTLLRKQIEQAGLTCWPIPWQNLRSTRETELAETWPIHVVCSWIGNSEAVTKNHYLQVTDEHFQSASRPQENPQESPAASTFQDVSQETTKSKKPAENNGFPVFPSGKQSSQDYTRRDSNPQPSVPKTDALSN